VKRIFAVNMLTEVSYRVHENLLLTHTLRQKNPVHTLTSCVLILTCSVRPCTAWSPKWYLPLQVCDKNIVCLSHLCMLHFPPNILLDLMTLVIFVEEYKLCSSFFIVISFPLLILLSYVQIFSSAPCFRTSSSYTGYTS
jgi:hypothetical protein